MDPTEAVIKALRWDDAHNGCMAARPGVVEDVARIAMEAAAPIIERQVREKIAQEIKALDRRGVPVWVNGYQHAIEDAAAIARGAGDKTEAGHG